MAGGENNDRLTLDIMRGIVERLQAAHVPLDERLDALMSATCRDGMAATKDGRVITVTEMYRDDLGAGESVVVPPHSHGPRGIINMGGVPLVCRERIVVPEEEWPARDAVPFVREAVVTPEMIEAGRETADMFELIGGFAPAAECIYRAMHAVAPVELVSEGERRAVRERDEARAELAELTAGIDSANRHHIRFRDQAFAQLASRDARIAELDSELAKATAALKGSGWTLKSEATAWRPPLGPRPTFADQEPETPERNPFREFTRDHRRIGG